MHIISRKYDSLKGENLEILQIHVFFPNTCISPYDWIPSPLLFSTMNFYSDNWTIKQKKPTNKQTKILKPQNKQKPNNQMNKQPKP